jgi:hypothetical protein
MTCSRPKVQLECCLCGSYAGRFHQHSNRDKGYGICGRCVKIELSQVGKESVLSCYGIAGYNYASPDSDE